MLDLNFFFFYVRVQSLSRVQQSDPLDQSLPDSSVHGIFQASILEWVTISFSGDLPDSGIKAVSSASSVLQADSLLLSHGGSPF